MRLSEFFTHSYLFAWVSAQNSASLYNHSLSLIEQVTTSIDDPLKISSEQVARAFALNALLRDTIENETTLILPDIGDNDERLKQAMELRNKRIIAYGQPQRLHACQLCEKYIPGSGYKNLRE